MDGHNAYTIEQQFQKEFKQYSYYNASISNRCSKNGATECFSDELPVEEVIELIQLLKQYQS